MGKKDKKKGKGAEKTASKTEKKATQKLKKEVAAKGEDDIDTLLANFVAADKKKKLATEDLVSPPSKRSSFTITPHPDKDQLIIFGGEYFNGNKTFVYNDLFFYTIKQNRWTQMTCPGGPPPRSGHQTVAVSQGGGQLWVFGGEFTSFTQSQFYHYKDLWVYYFNEKRWEKISASGGPSSRSGHRMVVLKKQLIVFGGFHESVNFKYFNDVYSFDLEKYTWTQLNVVGNGPSPRSACQMLALPDGRVVIYGGYSKEKLKNDVDKGVTHTDMYTLTPDKHDTTGTKYKWQQVKQSGNRPSLRCAFSLALWAPDKAVMFGGVCDEEDEDELEGVFYNDMHLLDLGRLSWHEMNVTGKISAPEEKKKRRRKKEDGGEEEDSEEEEDDTAMEKDLEKLNVRETSADKTVVSEDGIFTVTINASKEPENPTIFKNTQTNVDEFQPPPRINAGMVVKRGILYLYGGMYEDGDKQLTLNDFYSLDLNKLEEWNTIIPLNEKDLEWYDSDTSDDEDMDDEEESEDEDEEEEEDKDDNEMETA